MASESDYLYRRFAEEWERADTAADPRAAAVHQLLAATYLDRFERLHASRPQRTGTAKPRGRSLR